MNDIASPRRLLLALWFAAWAALALAAPALPAWLAIVLAIALFVAVNFLPGRRCEPPRT